MHQALSVSELNHYLRELLETNPLLSDVWVEGEVSEFKRHAASGHCYFSIKDAEALLRAVMWRSVAARLPALPRPGEAVLVHGYVSIYSQRGDLQLYADMLLPAGVGMFHARFEELKARLASEGLFNLDRKRPLPARPRRIGIVTGLQSAALHDMLSVLGRRCPLVEVLVAPCLVQGEQAPESIVAALASLFQAGVDVIIVARGGGSIEDLWSFNDEAVARAVFASPAPVITGVGHETDTTIVDLVADLRAPTPSAAAELVVPDMSELVAEVASARDRLGAAVGAFLALRRDQVAQAVRLVERQAPLRRLDRERQQVDDLVRRLERSVSAAVQLRDVALAGLAGRLQILDPQATLARGYAVVRRTDTGRVLTDPLQAPLATPLTITLRDGELRATVDKAGPQ
ncbi:MAG: exodeoxyribonuclease VII large subunit [Chloroflexaceae bacterium]